jgi:hypothetical protein
MTGAGASSELRASYTYAGTQSKPKTGKPKSVTPSNAGANPGAQAKPKWGVAQAILANKLANTGAQQKPRPGDTVEQDEDDDEGDDEGDPESQGNPRPRPGRKLRPDNPPKKPRARGDAALEQLLHALGRCIHALAEMNAVALPMLEEFASDVSELSAGLSYSAGLAAAIDEAGDDGDPGRALTRTQRRIVVEEIVRWATERR